MANKEYNNKEYDKKSYLDTLNERSKKSRVYKKYQLIGLTIAQLLNDEKHKSLYIKLAKEFNQEKLMSLAKDISERKNIENKGGYFMTVLTKLRKDTKLRIRKNL